MKDNIHPTAIIEEGASLHPSVVVEAYAIVNKNVTLHEGVRIKAHVYLDGHTTVGKNTTIYPFASIGTKTQDLKFKGERTFVTIGENCEIREYVTINSSCGEDTFVKVGNNCLIMTSCHIAHNCEVGNHVIMSNAATLAGHVIVEDHAIIGGLTPVHQFSRIGTFAMVGGMSRVTHDVPPYTIGGGVPYKLGGLNLIGLKRNDFSLKTRQALSRAFKIMFRSHLRTVDAVEKIQKEVEMLPEIAHLVDFCLNSKRGVMGITTQHDQDALENEDDKIFALT